MAYVIPIAFFDPPQVIDTSVTPIPANSSNPLQVIANTGLNIGLGISFNDTTGTLIGVFIGSAGQESLACIIGNGLSGQAWGRIPPYSRVSLRSMSSSSITSGLLQGTIFGGF